MWFNIEYSCHTITNIIHGWRLLLQLMTNNNNNIYLKSSIQTSSIDTSYINCYPQLTN